MTNEGPKYIAVQLGNDTYAHVAERRDDGSYGTIAGGRDIARITEMAQELNDREDLRTVTPDA